MQPPAFHVDCGFMSTVEYLPSSVPEAISDISTRFLWNLPRDELPSVERLFFQIQQAHWFYEDNYVGERTGLPHVPARDFTRMLFDSCDLLRSYRERSSEFLDRFKAYIATIPVFGLIILTRDLDRVLLVRGMRKSSTWTFPKGKRNEGESGLDCAVREAFEETGCDARGLAHEQNRLTFKNGAQEMTMYIAPGVPADTVFEPQTRNEIGEVRWFRLADIPVSGKSPGSNRFWFIRPFLSPLVNWIKRQRRGGAEPRKKAKRAPLDADVKNTDTFGDGAPASWSVQDMFRQVEKMTGRVFTYDGNPQDFGVARAAATSESKNGSGATKNGSGATRESADRSGATRESADRSGATKKRAGKRSGATRESVDRSKDSAAAVAAAEDRSPATSTPFKFNRAAIAGAVALAWAADTG